MGNKININVSGGSATFGAVSQGDGAAVQGVANITREQIEGHFAGAEQALAGLAKDLEKSRQEVSELLGILAALKEKASDGVGNTEEGKSLLESVRKNFSWAYPIVTDLVKVVWPVLFSAITT